MRVIGVVAAVFVLLGMLFAALAQGNSWEPSPPSWLLFVLFVGIISFVLITVAVFMYKLPWTKTAPPSEEEQIANLERQGLLVSVDFRATRAFKVGESEDEGPHYFLELENGNVLYMNGQYLYEYEQEDDADADDADYPATAAAEDIAARQFPCTSFTVRRHRDEDYVVDIMCRGDLLPAEYVELGVKKRDYFWDTVPDDGGILTGTSFDALQDALR